MKVNKKEKIFISKLIDQEQHCIEKYDIYYRNANTPELKRLLKEILVQEQIHFDILQSIINEII